MKGYIKGKNIILIEELPDQYRDGDEVEIQINKIPEKTYPFPTFNLGVKEEYLSREKIYESDQNIL